MGKLQKTPYSPEFWDKATVNAVVRILDAPKEIYEDKKYFRLFDVWGSKTKASDSVDRARKAGWNVRMKPRIKHGKPVVWLLYRRRGER